MFDACGKSSSDRGRHSTGRFSDDQVRDEFIAHTSDQVEAIEAEALKWEEDPSDPEPPRAIGGILHSIKGASGFIGLPEMSEVMHKTETLLADRGDSAPVDMILSVKDWCTNVMAKLSGEPIETPEEDMSAETGTLRILVVEDDPTSQKFMKKLLSPYGDCTVAADGCEGLEEFRTAYEARRPYDLICMDIMMPNMDGREVLNAIRG